MTTPDRDKTQARVVQKRTGMTYQTCLRLTRGEIAFEPQVRECRVLEAMAHAHAAPTVSSATVVKKCNCSRCDPGEGG